MCFVRKHQGTEQFDQKSLNYECLVKINLLIVLVNGEITQ